MGYARTKLEEVNERVKELEDQLGDWHATFPDRTASDAIALLQQANTERDELKARVTELENELLDRELLDRLGEQACEKERDDANDGELGDTKAKLDCGCHWCMERRMKAERDALKEKLEAAVSVLEVIAGDIGSTHAAIKAKEALKALRN